MTARLILATHNPHKVTELRRILGAGLGSITLQGYQGPEPVEDGASFAENALIKARAASAHTGLPAIADDSGICVDALGGAPGIHSARFAGTRNDGDNVRLLLQRMAGVAERGAEFRCAAALVLPGADGEPGFEQVEVGVWRGRLLTAAAGAGGFGYDPIFGPDGVAGSAAELSPAEKDALSHRTRAFMGLLPTIRQKLG